jgi:ADP-ribose pyrophosphatase YjhB (NUDIX family)
MATIVRSCNPTDPARTGHALVILHYLDKTTNTRTFFMGEESSYIERDELNSTGAVVMNNSGTKPKKERFRRFPVTVTNNAGQKAHILANTNYVANPTSHYVLRKNARRGNMKYTLQLPNGIWGFPKGAGNDINETAKDVAAREFLEEIGYTLDTSRLVFKKCVETEYYDTIERKRMTRQSVVFHYELKNADDTEKNAVLAAFAAKITAREGEIFNAGFFTEMEVNGKNKNRISDLAFSNFSLDHSTAVDQTNIPRGGTVVPAAPVPGSSSYVPPHKRPGYVAPVNPSVNPSASKPGSYIPPHRRKTPGGARKSRKRMTRKRR